MAYTSMIDLQLGKFRENRSENVHMHAVQWFTRIYRAKLDPFEVFSSGTFDQIRRTNRN